MPAIRIEGEVSQIRAGLEACAFLARFSVPNSDGPILVQGGQLPVV
jgi:hypothetical protein